MVASRLHSACLSVAVPLIRTHPLTPTVPAGPHRGLPRRPQRGGAQILRRGCGAAVPPRARCTGQPLCVGCAGQPGSRGCQPGRPLRGGCALVHVCCSCVCSVNWHAGCTGMDARPALLFLHVPAAHVRCPASRASVWLAACRAVCCASVQLLSMLPPSLPCRTGLLLRELGREAADALAARAAEVAPPAFMAQVCLSSRGQCIAVVRCAIEACSGGFMESCMAPLSATRLMLPSHPSYATPV